AGETPWGRYEAGLGHAPGMDRLDVGIAPGMTGQGVRERAICMLQGNISDRSACEGGGAFSGTLFAGRETTDVPELDAADGHIPLQQGSNYVSCCLAISGHGLLRH